MWRIGNQGLQEQDKKYCPRCGNEYIMYKSIKSIESVLCLSFNCNWAGFKGQLLNDKQKITFDRRKKLNKIENEN